MRSRSSFGHTTRASAAAFISMARADGVPTERRFAGTVRLVTLHLWRVAKSTDIEEGFKAASELGMLSLENEQFIRSCFKASEQLEEGEEPDIPITPQLVDELQACALRLNAADPA